MTLPAQDRVVDYYRDGVSVEELADGGVVITAPTRRSAVVYGLGAMKVAAVDIFIIPFLPFVFLGALPIYLLFGRQTPRVVLRVSRDEIVLETTKEQSLGRHVVVERWPRAKVTEFRPNQYGPGFYFRIAGEDNRDLMTDLPSRLVVQIDAALEPALRRLRGEPHPPGPHFQRTGDGVK